jgi:hypothetical protein
MSASCLAFRVPGSGFRSTLRIRDVNMRIIIFHDSGRMDNYRICMYARRQPLSANLVVDSSNPPARGRRKRCAGRIVKQHMLRQAWVVTVGAPRSHPARIGSPLPPAPGFSGLVRAHCRYQRRQNACAEAKGTLRKVLHRSSPTVFWTLFQGTEEDAWRVHGRWPAQSEVLFCAICVPCRPSGNLPANHK